MRRVPFDPPNGLNDEQLEWWNKWLVRAEQKQALAKAGEELDSSVWRALKDWLFNNVFYKKCAYCESKVKAVYPGDGEHYRPKGNVTVRVDGKKIDVINADTGQKHSGYYWLAYDWRNVLPACFECNNAKSDLFPVEQSHVHGAAPAPVELDATELPSLIYPYIQEPEEYLVFGDFGIVAPRDDNPRGKATIEVFDLMRDDLVDARHERQIEARSALKEAVGAATIEGKPVGDYLGGWIDEAAPYSMAVRAFVNLRLARLGRSV